MLLSVFCNEKTAQNIHEAKCIKMGLEYIFFTEHITLGSCCTLGRLNVVERLLNTTYSPEWVSQSSRDPYLPLEGDDEF